MGIVFNNEPGIILAGVFRRDAPGFREEVAQFVARLEQLKQELGFSHFVHATKEEQGRLTIKILVAVAETEDAPQPGETGWDAIRTPVLRRSTVRAEAIPLPPASPALKAQLRSEMAAELLTARRR